MNSHLPDRVVTVICACCRHRFQTQVGGMAYCDECMAGEHRNCMFLEMRKAS